MRLNRDLTSRLQAAQDALDDRVEPDDGLAEFDMEYVRASWASLETPARRRLLGAAIERVVIGPHVLRAKVFDPERISIVWRQV